MWEKAIDLVTTKAETIRLDYSVNPWVFLLLLVLCAPFFYYSIYRVVRSAAARNRPALFRWSTVFIGATSLPYLYVLLFGRNLPWWIYPLFLLLLGQGGYSLARKLRTRR